MNMRMINMRIMNVTNKYDKYANAYDTYANNAYEYTM